MKKEFGVFHPSQLSLIRCRYLVVRIGESHFVLLCTLDLTPEDLAVLRVVLEQMVDNHLLRRLAHPLEEREISELVRAEDLEHFDRFVPNILNKMTHISRHDAYVARNVVERSSAAFGGEDGDASSAPDEEVPLVGVRVPMHLAQRTGLDEDVGCRHRFGYRKVLGVCDTNLAPTR